MAAAWASRPETCFGPALSAHVALGRGPFVSFCSETTAPTRRTTRPGYERCQRPPSSCVALCRAGFLGLPVLILCQCSVGKVEKASKSEAASASIPAASSKRPPAWSTTRAWCAQTASWWACPNGVRTSVATVHRAAFGTVVKRFLAKWALQCYDAAPGSVAAMAAFRPMWS
jgi:hypothetical protein